VGATGCNFDLFCRKFKADPDFFDDLFAKRHVVLQLAVQDRDALVCMAEPEANQVFKTFGMVTSSDPSSDGSPC
jgi:hypothetical protein